MVPSSRLMGSVNDLLGDAGTQFQGLWIAWVSPAVRLWFCGGRRARNGDCRGAGQRRAGSRCATEREEKPKESRNQATQNDD